MSKIKINEYYIKIQAIDEFDFKDNILTTKDVEENIKIANIVSFDCRVDKTLGYDFKFVINIDYVKKYLSKSMLVSTITYEDKKTRNDDLKKLRKLKIKQLKNSTFWKWARN